MSFYSQFGQDRWLSQTVFKNIKNGYFVEIGADDGIQGSNTKYFEEIGWTGVCIEPSPKRFLKLTDNRKCHCENVAISNTDDTVQFMDISGYGKQLSGIVNMYDPRHKTRIEGDLNNPKNTGYEIVDVRCVTLNSVLDKYDIQHVDFCSIDTEGAEVNILSSIDFDAINIRVIMVENNYKDESIDTILTKNGYTKRHSISIDDIYVKD